MSDTTSRAQSFIDQHVGLAHRLALDIHAHPEPNYEEFFAANAAAGVLDEFGLDVERGVADIPTAFTATIAGARPGPVIGLVAEYDCVPGVGHGCGHNLICGATVAAGLGLRSVAAELTGTVVVFGCPAEEGGRGKKRLADAGVFDGLDAALQFHPATRSGITTTNMLAQNLFFRFTGRPAHTTAEPWEGLNALDAVISLFNAVNALRQQVHPDIRITGIITDQPDTIASIPELAGAMFRVRGFDLDSVLQVVDRVRACGAGAALQAGVEAEIWTDEVEPQLRCSEILGELLNQEGAALGIDFSDHDVGYGTTDLAYIGRVAPTLMFRLKTWPEGTPAHSQAAVEASKSPEALDQMLAAAKTIVGMTVELLENERWLERASTEFAAPQPVTLLRRAGGI